MITLTELRDFLAKNLDETEVMELLEVDSEDLLNAFLEKLEDNFDKICMKCGIE